MLTIGYSLSLGCFLLLSEIKPPHRKCQKLTQPNSISMISVAVFTYYGNIWKLSKYAESEQNVNKHVNFFSNFDNILYLSIYLPL